MNSVVTASIVLACLVGAVFVGMLFRRMLPQEHVSADSRDVIKLAIGLVATMSALVLGLLVSSAKGSYDAERSEVIQMASKIAFLGRVLDAYGPEASGVRAQLRDTLERGMHQLWPAQLHRPVSPAGEIEGGNAVYIAIQHLSPQNDVQTAAKSQAAALVVDLGQLRSLLVAQAVPSISEAMLIILVCWLAIIFLGFSALAPPNRTAIMALVVSAIAVSGAILLILELDEPFGGIIGISSEPMVKALHQLAQ